MKKIIRLWYSYDFANSFASVVLVFYYPLFLSSLGASNVWVGVSASISTFILLVILPYLGNYSDRTGKRLGIIRIASVLMVLSLFAIAFLAQDTEVASTPLLLVFSILYILFQICFQGSYVFYSSMLREITDDENNVKVSGIGLGLGQFGNALGLGIIGPIIGSSFVFIGLSGRPLAFFIGAVIFIFTSWPFLRQKEVKKDVYDTRFSYKEFTKKVFSTKRVFYFIIGYALLSDAILTFQLYLSLYVNKVFSFSDKLVSYAGITGLVGCVAGAFFAGKLSLKLKDEERALGLSSLFYAACFCLFAIVPKTTFVVFLLLALSGLSYGLVFSLARTVYSKIAPKESQGEFFSVFTVFERAASVVGPLVWILTFYLLTSFGENIQYRGSVLLLTVVCLGGFYFLKKSSSLR